MLATRQTAKRKRLARWEKMQSRVKELFGSQAVLRSVIVLNRRIRSTSIHCYGVQVRDGRIFNILNLSTDMAIKYRPRTQLPRRLEGYFVKLRVFQRANSNEIVALVNIPHRGKDFEEVKPFKVNSL